MSDHAAIEIAPKAQYDNERTGLLDPSAPQKIAQGGAYIAKTAVDSVSRISAFVVVLS